MSSARTATASTRQKLSNHLGVPVVEISAVKGDGVMEAAQAAPYSWRAAAKRPFRSIASRAASSMRWRTSRRLSSTTCRRSSKRWFAVKIFERDERIIEKLNIPKDKLAHIENDIKACEKEMDDDSQSIITAARYSYIASIRRLLQKEQPRHEHQR
ncbi:MAG: hypothetical protein V8Q79_05240 [Christensenellales bacterium]